jgi:REP element-mobilizing transposase RayT
MARLARVKAENSGAFYHLCGRVAGVNGEYPLNDKHVRRKLVDYIRIFSSVYCCQVLGFCIMGNHYHLVVSMDAPRSMGRKELRERASILYKDELLDGWLAASWLRFEARVFDVSELMRSLQSKIARWFNLTHNRRGRFWADRFKSVLLEDEKAMFDCLLYVELNPVRAKIAQRPEEFDGSSLYYRELKDDKWMASLTEITGRSKRLQALRDYKSCIYYRGSVPTKENQAAISKRIIKEEEARGFASKGLFVKRIRHFTDGVVIGSEAFVREKIDRLRNAGQYLRRKNPVLHPDGMHASLREQRKTL